MNSNTYIVKIRENIHVLLILGISLIVRVIRIGMPILEGTLSRQIQTASITRFFYHNGIDILRSKIDYLYGNAGYLVLEFPLYNILLTSLYKMTGGVHEYIGRLLSILFFLGSSFFVFLIVKKIYDYRTALIALAVYNFSPLGIIFSRAIMPDSEMLFFCTGTIFFLLHFADTGKRWSFWISALMGMLALLVKIQSFYIVVPLFFIIFYRQRYKCFVDYRNYLFLIMVVVPALLWYTNAAAIYNEISPERVRLFQISNWFDPAVFLSQDLYKDLLRVGAGILLTPVGFVLFLMGVMVKPQKRIEMICFAWLGGAALYLLVFNALLWEDYYYLPVLPVASVFIARSFQLDWTKTLKKSYLSTRGGRILGIVIVGLLIMRYALYAYMVPFGYRFTPEIADSIRNVSEPEELIVINQCPEINGIMYYSQRKGWPLSLPKGKESFELQTIDDGLRKFTAEGARYFITVEGEGDNYYPISDEAYQYLNDRYNLVKQEGNKYRIYDLK